MKCVALLQLVLQESRKMVPFPPSACGGGGGFGGDFMQVDLVLTWDEPEPGALGFIVERDEQAQRLAVSAHAGLSDHQVRAACAQLGDDGDHVYRAWREKVAGPMQTGLDPKF